jgi:hypothetical protein
MITCTGDPSEEASMPATNDRIRRTMKVERTRDDAGHKLSPRQANDVIHEAAAYRVVG